MQLYQLSFPNGKKYIGITSKTAQQRLKEHCNPSKNKTICQNAIHKYGKENVVLTVIAECDNWELLCLSEIEAIEKFNTFKPNGYNLTLGGEGAHGVVISEETRLKMSKPKSSKENYHKPKGVEHRRKIGLANSKRIVSEETRIKMSKKKSDDHVKNMSLSNLEKNDTLTICSNGMEFKNITTAVNWLKSIGFEKAARAGISRCANDKPTATAYGFGWIRHGSS